MAAKFLAAGSFYLRARNLFVVFGDIAAGEVHAGMQISVPLNGTPTVAGIVSSVEPVDFLHEGRAYVALTIACNGPEELWFWQAMNLSDETLTLI